jgi:hypothetical protein
MKRIVVVIALVALMMMLMIAPASARTDNVKACFGQNTSYFVSQGVSLKEEAAGNGFSSVGAMLQFFHAELPFGCIGKG